MDVLTPPQIEALTVLMAAVAPRRSVLIGATALAFHLKLSWRRTLDLDLALAVNVEEIRDLAGQLDGWRVGQHPHRWHAPSGVTLDIVPASPALLEHGTVTWPSGAVFSLLGIELALNTAKPVVIGTDLTIPIARCEVIALLKMNAYLDRPWERENDLGDLAHLLEDWLEPDAPERFETGVDYELASAHVLGLRLGRLVNDGERAVIAEFLRRLRDESDPARTQVRMLRHAPRAWKDEPAELLARWQAFEHGVSGVTP